MITAGPLLGALVEEGTRRSPWLSNLVRGVVMEMPTVPLAFGEVAGAVAAARHRRGRRSLAEQAVAEMAELASLLVEAVMPAMVSLAGAVHAVSAESIAGDRFQSGHQQRLKGAMP